MHTATAHEPTTTAVLALPTAPGRRAGARQAGQQHWDQGLALAGQRNWKGAARAFGRAAKAAPQDGLYWLNLAHAERHAGQVGAAMAAARRCLKVDPGQTLALRLLGECLLQQHAYFEACDVYMALEAAGVLEADAMLHHASALMQLLRFAEATELLLRALALQPGLVAAHAMLGSALRDQGLKREAVECLRTVIALEPDNLEARVHLSFEKRHLCDWADYNADVQEISDLLATMPEGLARKSAAFASLSQPIAPELQLAASRGEALAQACGVLPLPDVKPFKPSLQAPKRVRVGFVSYDFRQHPVSQLVVELLEGLCRQQFEVLLYSTGPDDATPLRRRVQAAADHFVDLRGLSDQQAAERMRADGVELLVDLMGHTRGSRMGILARRPAPVQVAYLGYPASTGAPYIDYLIGDPLVTPLALAPLYSEKLAQMPLCFQPNGRWRPLPQPMTRAEAGLPDDAFVMCAFNHTYKIGPEAFDAWCAVLRDVPHAVLWLKETNQQLHANVRREAEARGVDPVRILWAKNVPYEAHFSRLALADVFVDTWPYNAHTTAADALWAGVPVVTVYGNGFASRVAASALNAVGLAELALDTPDAYRCAITALALDPALLAGYRQHLVQQRLTLPLFDSQRYTQEMQTLLGRMAQRWRAGLGPAHLLSLDAA